MNRRRLFVGAAAAVLLATFLFWTLRSLDARVARVIERVGSDLTGTAVRVGRVDLDLAEGRGTLRNLRVANPAGFSSQPALEFGEITLDLEVGGLGRVPLVLSEVRLRAPVVQVEINAEGRSNVGVLLERLNGEEASAGAAPQDEAGTRLRVERFRFEEGLIEGDAGTGDEPRSLALPSLRVTDLGGPNGMTPAELGRSILLRYLGHVAWVAAKDATFRFLEAQAEELGDRVGEAAKGILRALRGDSGGAPEPD